jgi:hypothetical protein
VTPGRNPAPVPQAALPLTPLLQPRSSGTHSRQSSIGSNVTSTAPGTNGSSINGAATIATPPPPSSSSTAAIGGAPGGVSATVANSNGTSNGHHRRVSSTPQIIPEQ